MRIYSGDIGELDDLNKKKMKNYSHILFELNGNSQK